MSNFMTDDEFLLLMVHCENRSIGCEWEHILTADERKILREIGLKTAHEQPAWASIEPSKGVYNFDYLNTIIERNRAADMKSLMYVAGWTLPKWIPNEWRAKRKDGIYETEVLSMWNEEAQQYSDSHYRLLYDTFNADDLMWIFGEYQGGEGAYPPTWCLYDHAALEDYKRVYGSSAVPIPDNPDTMLWYGNKIIEHFVRKSQILYPKYKEVWNMQQYLMDTWTKAFGNFVHKETLLKYRELWPDGNIVLLQATYYDDSHKQDNVEFVDMLRDVSKCEVIVEAMFCKGLPITTPKAISQGFRGQIVRPAFEGGSTTLEQWMIDNIRTSQKQWEESKK